MIQNAQHRRAHRTFRLLRTLLAALCVAGVGAALLAADTPKRKSAARPKKAAPKSKKIDPKDVGPAGPSTERPERALTLWSTGPTVQWRADAYALYVKADSLISDLRSNIGQAKPRWNDIGRAHVLLLQLARLNKSLEIWSEPAGVDMALRKDRLHERFIEIVADVRGSHLHTITTNLAKFALRCKKQLPALEQIKRMASDGDPEDALERLLKIYDQLAVEGVWYPTVDVTSPLAPYERLANEIQETVNEIRKREADLAINEGRKRPDFVLVTNEVRDAITALGRNGKCTVAGKTLSGPDALAAFLDRWQELHLISVHSLAMDWVAHAKEREPQIKPDPAVVKAEAELAQSLAQLIDADAKRAKDDELTTLYTGYLRALAPTLPLAKDETRVPFQAALERMVHKSAGLESQVAAYRAGTSDLLRWRARLAETLAARAAQAAKPAGFEFKPLIDMPAPEKVRALSTGVVGKPAVAKQLIGSPDSVLSLSGLNDQAVYYAAPPPEGLKAAKAWLRSGLLADNSLEPLTLDAAVALASTDRGNLVECGGTLRELELQGLIPLFAHAGPADWGLVRLQDWPLLYRQSDPLTQLRVRALIEPRWYRLPYAFLERPSTPDAVQSASRR